MGFLTWALCCLFFAVGVLGVGVYHGAYIARSGQGRNQLDPQGTNGSSSSQGFSFWEAMRYIILPQASRLVLPPLTNQADQLN